MGELAAGTDRGTLESIVESDAAPEVRRAAAERLFSDAHVRTHARYAVREAALRVIEDREILRAIAEHDSEPLLRARALHRLGEKDSVRVCGLCGEVNLASSSHCECGFDLVKGDLGAAKVASADARRRGTREIVAGVILIGLAFAGGLALLPIHVTATISVGFASVGFVKVDVVCMIAGLALIARGKRLRARPWTGIAPAP